MKNWQIDLLALVLLLVVGTLLVVDTKRGDQTAGTYMLIMTIPAAIIFIINWRMKR